MLMFTGPLAPSMRVASLAPSNTEIVALLGQGDQLVGVDDWSDWPADELEGLARLGPDLQIDLDLLERIEPDLVLSSTSVPGMEPVVDGVAERGLEQLVLAPKSIEEIQEDVCRVAQALGCSRQGDQLARSMTDEIDRVQQATRGLERVRVLWEWWPKPVIVAGGPGWMSEVIELAGGTNVMAGAAEESVKITLEEASATEPDVLALCWQGALASVQNPARVRARPGWRELRAVREGRILEMPEELFGRPGPRIVEGVRLLATELHPELAETLADPWAWPLDVD